jgi:hypothetical protein
MENTKELMPFTPFPKIARLSREVVISEKLDGTNGLVEIRELPDDQVMPTDTPIVAVVGKMLLYAGSRTTWITPEKDNYGFASWVKANSEELVKLGPGRHFGEWWGQGIQRKYGLSEKRWSLFNTSRWLNVHADNFRGFDSAIKEGKMALAPSCCHVVPVVYIGVFDTGAVGQALDALRINGSKAAPGFMNPEGVIIYHTHGDLYFKKTIHKDEEYKGKSII